MIGVLIVEDEMIVRFGIKSMVNWEAMGLTVIGDATNGKEALEIFYAYNPEIVITDIKMPVMDGIELLKKIRETNKETSVIILSSLQDFNAAREAIKYGASEYLIKSDMMPSDMENVLSRVKASMLEKNKFQLKVSPVKKSLPENEEIKKESFLWDITMGAVSKNKASMEKIMQLGVDYLKNQIYVLVESIDYYEKNVTELLEYKKRAITNMLLMKTNELIYEMPECNGEVYKGDSGEIIILLVVSGNDGERHEYETVYHAGEKIVKGLKDDMGYSVTIGISNPVADLFQIKEGYFQANKAYKFKMFCGCGKVIEYNSTITIGRSEKLIVKSKELRDNIYLLKYASVEELIDNTFNKIIDCKDYEGVNFVSMELIMNLCAIFTDVCNDSEKVYQKKKEYYDKIKFFETIEDIRQWFKDEFRGIIDYIRLTHSNDKKVIQKALTFIEENYSKQINLQSVSEHVHLSKNYFVNLFRREAGESFIEYLTKIRIEKAKELLKNTSLKRSEIGQMVGIEDSRYFSKVFKKITGYTPTEYKEL